MSNLNIKKIRGILSAKNGTHIPKFENPSGPINYQNMSNWIRPDWYNTQNQYITSGTGIAEPQETSIVNSRNESDYTPKKLERQGLFDVINKIKAEDVKIPSKTFKLNDPKNKSSYDKLKEKASNFISNNTKLISIGLDSVGNVLNSGITNSKDVDAAFGTIDTVGNVASQFNPAFGLAIKVGSTALKGINNLGGKYSDKFSINQDTMSQIGGSYSGSASDIIEAASNSNKKYGLFSNSSRKKANRQIREANLEQNIMTNIANENQDYLAMGENYLNYLNYNFNQNGGFDQRYMRVAKSGMKLSDKIDFIKKRHKLNSFIDLDSEKQNWEPIIEDVPTMIEEWTPVIKEFKEGGTLENEEFIPVICDIFEPIIVENFKSGGKTEEKEDVPEIEKTTQKNIIPEGALHKNKHHIENTEGLTQKGIPVVDNEGKQQAEVECEEIIFTLEVTKVLEERYHKYYSEDLTQKEKDELAIEVGKLLVKEILYNTDDRANLIDKCKEGGKL